MPQDRITPENSQQTPSPQRGNGPAENPPIEGDKTEGRFSGISKERWQELLQHYAEIQRYQKAHGLDDRGDPPD